MDISISISLLSVLLIGIALSAGFWGAYNIPTVISDYEKFRQFGLAILLNEVVVAHAVFGDWVGTLIFLFIVSAVVSAGFLAGKYQLESKTD